MALRDLLICFFLATECASAGHALAQNLAPLSTQNERALNPKDTFQECDKCPKMVVVPAGSFLMGSPETEKDRGEDEGPQHRVTISRPFAVAFGEVTFAEWHACVQERGCRQHEDPDVGRGGVIGLAAHLEVSFDDAHDYVQWLSLKTGKTYRLLSEAEWEYAMRAGTTGPFWGPGRGNMYQLWGIGAPNYSEWTEDCYHKTYSGAPVNGAAWTAFDCRFHVARGGGAFGFPESRRYAHRAMSRLEDLKALRAARTLAFQDSR